MVVDRLRGTNGTTHIASVKFTWTSSRAVCDREDPITIVS